MSPYSKFEFSFHVTLCFSFYKRATFKRRSYLGKNVFILKFIYSEKATKFCEISNVDLSYVVPVQSKVEISQNFVAFSEYMIFINSINRRGNVSPLATSDPHVLKFYYILVCILVATHKTKVQTKQFQNFLIALIIAYFMRKRRNKYPHRKWSI